MIGHNERPLRLDIAARDARTALAHVAKGESMALDGWLAYGQCLNEARALFPSDDKGFGQWLANLHRQLVGVEPNDHERAAAMWAAANPEQFDEARAAGKARTVRGIYSKWAEIEAARQAEPETDAPVIDQAPDETAQEAEPGDDAQDLQPPEADDPHADDRAKLAKLTRDGLEDEVIGLRAENGELRGKVTKLTGERDHWKSLAKEWLDAKSGDEVIRRMSKTINRMKLQIFRESKAASVAARQRRKAEDARDDALRRLGEQVIEIKY